MIAHGREDHARRQRHAREAPQGGRRQAAARPAATRYVFSYSPPTKAFKLQLTFAKSQVERDEIIGALEAIIQELRQQH